MHKRHVIHYIYIGYAIARRSPGRFLQTDAGVCVCRLWMVYGVCVSELWCVARSDIHLFVFSSILHNERINKRIKHVVNNSAERRRGKCGRRTIDVSQCADMCVRRKHAFRVFARWVIKVLAPRPTARN